MATDSFDERESDESESSDLTEFFGLLNELKRSGCTLLVVGDAPRHAFTRASAQLLGERDAVRYRLVAATDATIESVVERLPNPDEAPRPLAEMTHVLNHAGAPRSVTASPDPDGPPTLADVPETRIADPQLTGLKSALVEGIEEFARDSGSLEPADLRVGVDSLKPLIGFYGAGVVRRCFRTVSHHATEHDAMAHYVLPEPYGDDDVQTLVHDVDAVIELRAVNPDEFGHDAQQRWHVPSHDVSTDWTPL